MTFECLEDLVVAAAEGVRPPERLNVWQAAEKYRHYNNPGAYIGPWKRDKTPYLLEPMEVLTQFGYTGMIFIGPARTGKSDMFFNFLTYIAQADPSDLMMIGITQASIRDWSIKELQKFFRDNPEVGRRVSPGRQAMNVHDIRMVNGDFVYAKWPTISELSGKTIRRGWIMDYDHDDKGAMLDVAGEGMAYDLLKKRSQTYGRLGMTVAESSPGYPVLDPKWVARTPHEAPPAEGILTLYNRGDRRRWYWRCPKCHEAFEPHFKLFDYPTSIDKMESAEQVVLVCPHDGFRMIPSMKHELNAGGRWVKDGMRWAKDGSMRGTPIRSDIASFWMFGPAAAFQDWKSIVFNYLVAAEEYEQTGSEGGLKKTVTADQGMAYTPRALANDRLPEELKMRAEDWGGSEDNPVVPDGVRFLVATIDVQAGGRPSFVVHVHGYGVGNDVWIVDMFKIRKSEDRFDDDGEHSLLDPAGYPEDWHQLVQKVIERTYPLNDGSGRRMAIKMIGCDSGGREGVTTNAYNFYRWLRDYQGEGHHKRFLLLKGEGKPTVPRFKLNYPDSQRKDRKAGARGDVPVGFMNSNLMKDQIHAKLGRSDPGGGMVHFPVWAPDWLYSQLTAETRTPKGWENLRGKRNEAWDLLYYADGLVLHPTIRIETIDWTKPPSWAGEWEKNDLIVKAEGDRPFAKKSKKTLKELAERLG